MLTTIGDLLVNANGHTPLILLLAAICLAAAGWIGVRVFRSLQRQGARVGALEAALKLERIRRRQTEQVLREQGIELPYWPGDPAELIAITNARRRSYEPYREPDDEPETAQAEAVYPPLPPLTQDERDRFARHRRSSESL